MDSFTYLSNAHTSYFDQLYAAYRQQPESVDISWQKFFEGFEFAQQYGDGAIADAGTPLTQTVVGTDISKEFRVSALIHSYRQRGHLLANTNPVRKRKDRKPWLDLADFNLSEADLSKTFAAGQEIGLSSSATLAEIIDRLKSIYLGTVGFEYSYIRRKEQYYWLKNKIENEYPNFKVTLEEKKRILTKLNEAVVFENFLHTKFLGQKRFSLEGGETTIPALDFIIQHGASLGISEFIIGMAHRGRLNVLANIMQKTYEHIFNEFEGKAEPDLTMGDGDVKYHMGYSSDITTNEGKSVHLKLAPNPSHLEAVNPAVIGFVRAKLAAVHQDDTSRIMPILIHGDAAIAGQGIVYEVTQMARLNGYTVGGTLHFVINNQVGFTTDFHDARSSTYCTDVAKIIDAPVFHVNGDDPEAVVFAVKLAVEYRQKFKEDVFVDMVCYRRHGHNESDEPKFTQPNLYNIIAKHPNPREVYIKLLLSRGDIEADLAEKMDSEFRAMLQDRLNMVKQKPLPYAYQKLDQEWRELRKSTPDDFEQSPETSISESIVEEVGKALTTVPENFKPLKQIEKLLKERHEMFFKTKMLNWAAGELLAYGSVLSEGKIVRISGQDVQRGTFSHRHAVLNDAITNAPYNSLEAINNGQGKFRIYNSLLSEYAVLGFEFGYAMANPNALVIWEAQFGDFANGAQTMIDQFISSTESKWQRMNGIVMLLPHGYEGQGPEHSNARPERFLQLCGEYNMVVANITTPANFFHLLRRQLTWPFRKPCVVMSPKSLLRHPSVVSPVSDFTNGKFKELIDDPNAKADKVKKVILCTGKVYYDLVEGVKETQNEAVALVRIEQLYPFPHKQLETVLAKYKKAKKLVWVQEEPENMGAWAYILRQLRKKDIDVVARKESASPATGYLKVHIKEQAELIKLALSV
jgi:2-oxoglutarate dehydrogenase E1 component